MIDTKELRRLAQAALAGPDGISLNWIKLLQDFQQSANPAAISELLDRLEAEESKQAALLDCLNEWKALAKSAEKERDALRAKIAEMEKQEPVVEVQWAAGIPNGILDFISTDGYLPKLGDKLYALPGAQPQLNEIKIALQRALELGQREAWTGVRKHRSWEDQREEQQCWNKVWSLLGEQGEEK